MTLTHAGKRRLAIAALVAAIVSALLASCSSPSSNARTHAAALATTPAAATSTAQPATTPASSAAAPESACSFVVAGAAICASTDPQVKVYANFGSNTSACTFDRNITWGDGTASKNIVFKGGPAGARFVAAHTYSAPGTYIIYFGGKVRGPCTIHTPTFQFHYLSS